MRRRHITALALFVAARGLGGEIEDAQRLFDLGESYYRAEAKVVAEHETSLKDFAQLLLKARLKAIADQRAELGVIAREKGVIAIEEGGFCGIHIRNLWPSRDTPEYKALGEYSKSHLEFDRQYVTVSERFDAEILKVWGTNRAQCHALLKRFIPNLDDDLPNQPPDRMPGSSAPGANKGH